MDRLTSSRFQQSHMLSYYEALPICKTAMHVAFRLDAVVEHYVSETWCDVERIAHADRLCGKRKSGRRNAVAFRLCQVEERFSLSRRSYGSIKWRRLSYLVERPQDTEN